MGLGAWVQAAVCSFQCLWPLLVTSQGRCQSGPFLGKQGPKTPPLHPVHNCCRGRSGLGGAGEILSSISKYGQVELPWRHMPRAEQPIWMALVRDTWEPRGMQWWLLGGWGSAATSVVTSWVSLSVEWRKLTTISESTVIQCCVVNPGTTTTTKQWPFVILKRKGSQHLPLGNRGWLNPCCCLLWSGMLLELPRMQVVLCISTGDWVLTPIGQSRCPYLEFNTVPSGTQ